MALTRTAADGSTETYVAGMGWVKAGETLAPKPYTTTVGSTSTGTSSPTVDYSPTPISSTTTKTPISSTTYPYKTPLADSSYVTKPTTTTTTTTKPTTTTTTTPTTTATTTPTTTTKAGTTATNSQYAGEDPLAAQLRAQYGIEGPIIVSAGQGLITTNIGVFALENGKVVDGPMSFEDWQIYDRDKSALDTVQQFAELGYDITYNPTTATYTWTNPFTGKVETTKAPFSSSGAGADNGGMPGWWEQALTHSGDTSPGSGSNVWYTNPDGSPGILTTDKTGTPGTYPAGTNPTSGGAGSTPPAGSNPPTDPKADLGLGINPITGMPWDPNPPPPITTPPNWPPKPGDPKPPGWPDGVPWPGDVTPPPGGGGTPPPGGGGTPPPGGGGTPPPGGGTPPPGGGGTTPPPPGKGGPPPGGYPGPIPWLPIVGGKGGYGTTPTPPPGAPGSGGPWVPSPTNPVVYQPPHWRSSLGPFDPYLRGTVMGYGSDAIQNYLAQQVQPPPAAPAAGMAAGGPVQPTSMRTPFMNAGKGGQQTPQQLQASGMQPPGQGGQMPQSLYNSGGIPGFPGQGKGGPTGAPSMGGAAPMGQQAGMMRQRPGPMGMAAMQGMATPGGAGFLPLPPQPSSPEQLAKYQTAPTGMQNQNRPFPMQPGGGLPFGGNTGQLPPGLLALLGGSQSNRPGGWLQPPGMNNAFGANNAPLPVGQPVVPPPPGMAPPPPIMTTNPLQPGVINPNITAPIPGSPLPISGGDQPTYSAPPNLPPGMAAPTGGIAALPQAAPSQVPLAMQNWFNQRSPTPLSQGQMDWFNRAVAAHNFPT